MPPIAPAVAETFSINTYAYTQTHSAADCLGHLADQGYKAFELMMYPGHLWPEETDSAGRRALRRRIERDGLELVTINMPNVDLNIAGATAEMRAYSLGRLEAFTRLAGDLGAAGIVVGPGKPNPLFPAPREQLMGHLFAALDRLCPIAKAGGTQIYLENMPFAFLPGIDAMLEALDSYGNDDIAIIYDVANGHFIGEDIGTALRKCRHRLKLVHFSDTGTRVYRHDAVGLGDVPFADVPPVLKEIGYTGKPMLEVISRDPDAEIAASAEKLYAMGYR